MSGGAEPPRFACDVMLGRLARWLRILGYDVAYGPHLRRLVLLRCARREGRLLLTRDTRLLRDPELPPHVFLRSDHFREQLREVAARVPLGTAALLTRCLDCNRPLEAAPRATAQDRVPPYVLETQARFQRCPGCGKLYWSATHRARMEQELLALGFARSAPEGPGVR
ncbi:MAG: Mut7-C RNAse domain-containing protein [Candidatus Binatia bacterium]